MFLPGRGWGSGTLDNTKPVLKACGQAHHGATIPMCCREKVNAINKINTGKSRTAGLRLQPKGNILSCLCNTLSAQRPRPGELAGQRSASPIKKEAAKINNISREGRPACDRGANVALWLQARLAASRRCAEGVSA